MADVEKQRPDAETAAPTESAESPAATAWRVVLLGASNVTLGFPRLIEGLGHSLSGPVDVLAAHGHGRSYGIWSCVLGRSLPGIVPCGLWPALQERPAAEHPLLALVTDVGNDLLYGVDVDRLLGWVRTCLERLRALNAEIILTRVPLCSVERLSRVRYQATKAVFFPFRRLAFSEMRRRAAALDEGLSRLGAELAHATIEPQGAWYGFDPIHIRRRLRSAVWQEILANWSAACGSIRIDNPGLRRSLRLWTLTPQQRRILGIPHGAAQPCYHDAQTQLTLSLF